MVNSNQLHTKFNGQVSILIIANNDIKLKFLSDLVEDGGGREVISTMINDNGI